MLNHYFNENEFKYALDYINRYPFEAKEVFPNITMDLKYIQEKEDESKVKRLSQIDKFNRRFNRN